MNKTKIPWADYTWNPISGCSPISEGCENCYASAMSKRFGWKWGEPVFHPERIDQPAKIKKPSKIFVCSMSDLFHEKNDQLWIDNIFQQIYWGISVRNHIFIILTKRPERMKSYFENWNNIFEKKPEYMNNIWIGVTVENQKTADERIPILLDIEQAKVRFVSAEPLLEEICLRKINATKDDTINCLLGIYSQKLCKNDYNDFRIAKIDWVIAGGETGTSSRECFDDWIEGIYRECENNNTPFFFKQWGNKTKRIIHQDTKAIIEKIRQFPEVK